jgi:histidine triad (HIT) family protein
MTDCVFCDIAARTTAAKIIHESSEFICFEPLEQEVPGHTFIASKAHFRDMRDATPAIGSDLIRICQELVAYFQLQGETAGFNLLAANGVAAQQSIMHLHYHFLPRRLGDQINAWPSLAGQSSTSK